MFPVFMALLLTFPELKTSEGPVREALRARHADQAVLNVWGSLVALDLLPEGDDY